MRNLLVVLLSVIALSGCVSGTVTTQNIKSLETTNFSEMNKLVLVPIKVEVKESGIGSLEKLPERSELATTVVLDEVRKAFSNNGNVEMVEYQPINDDQRILLDEYVGLYQRVAAAAESIQYMGPAWKDRGEDSFDYTLGNGLEFLRDATGSDKAVFVYGSDVVASGGKKALAVLALLGGIAVNPGGIAVLHVGVVDLNTGDLLWSNSSVDQGMSLEENDSVSKALSNILSGSPMAATAPE